MKKNLFVVASPLQIINANEAINYFSLINNVFVVIYNSNDIHNIQIDNILKNIKTDEVIKIKPSRNGKFFEYVKIIRYLKKYIYNYLFIGDMGSINRVIIPNLKKDKVFLIDDGIGTIDYYNNFLKNSNINKYKFSILRFLLLGFKINIKDSINLFTYFDFNKNNNIEIVKNNLTCLKNRLNSSSNNFYDDDIFFLGQPFDACKKLEEYKDDLYTLYKNKNKKIIYIPHRYEPKEQTELIKNLEYVEFLKLNEPVEMFFINNNIYPKYVVSHITTALITLKMIYNSSKIEYIKLEKNIVNQEIYNHILNTYEYYEKISLEQCFLDKI